MREVQAEHARARAEQLRGRELEEKRARELAEHRAACSASPCGRCGRFACEQECGRIVSIPRATCADCARVADVEQFAQRIPDGYRDVVTTQGEARLDALGLLTPDGTPRVRLPRERLAAALAWAAAVARPPSLILVGPLRHGKTSTAAALLGAWFAGQHGRDPSVAKQARFLDAQTLGLAREQHKLGAGEAPLVVDAIGASVLVLDDVGQEPPRHAEVVRHVVRRRADFRRATWITTWMTREELAERYADAGFAARVFEAKIVRFGAAT